MRVELLPLLLLAPAAWLALSAVDRARARKLGEVLGPRVPVRRRRCALVAAGLLFALVAILGPAWGAAGGDVVGRDIAVCLDVSRSMLARDVAPDRLTRAKAEIKAFAGRAGGDRLGLVVFAGEARAMVPLTEDMASFAELVDLAEPASVGRGGTDLGAALEAALGVLQGRSGAVVLVTDGEDLGGRGLAAAKLLKERGVAVHCVGVGTELGSKITTEGGFVRDRDGRDVVSAMDAAGLRAIAEATGGTFGGEMPEISVTRRTGTTERRENRYQWPLAAAVLLWLLELAGGTGFVLPRVRPVRDANPVKVNPVPFVLLLLVCACGNRYEETVAALRAGDSGAALAASEGTAWHDFVRGSVAFARSEAADGLDLQIALAEDAVAAWRVAAMTRDWPEARRNVERGLLRLQGLYEKKSGKERKPPDGKPPPIPPPPGKEEGPEAEAELEKGELAQAQVLRLLDLLREKEAKKLAARRARLGAAQPGVEKDW